jgi:fatty-acyl-CoA synthase
VIGLDHRTVGEALAAAAASNRGIRVLEHDHKTRRLSYAELLAGALEIAGALRDAGLTPGERVALVVPEVGEFIRAFFGISTAGLVPVPLCPPAQAGDLEAFAVQSRHILDKSRAAAVITTSAVAPLLDARRSGITARILVLDQLCGHALAEPVILGPEAPALLQFTSGSTSAPKGVLLTHANIQANVTAIAGPSGLDAQPADIGVSWLPLYHDMGLIGMLLTGMYAGLEMVVMSPVLFLKRPTAWLEAISTYRGTVSFAPNFAYDLCVRRIKPAQIDTLDLSSWRAAGCGAEPIRFETLRTFVAQFGRAGFRGESFVPSYGLAEHSVAVTIGHGRLVVDEIDVDRLVRQSVAMPADPSTARVARIVGCGRSFPGHAIRIVDDEGRPLPERAVGAIAARGPSVMKGYFEDPIATDEVMHDGWLHSGDVGYMADGQLFVCGRTKDLIIRHGRKYHPPDLESAIAGLPGISPSGVVVFGITRLEEPDQVIAVIEARASRVHAELLELARQRVRETAGLELDRIIIARPGTVPRTTSGKVRRATVRERFQAGEFAATAESV